MRYVDEDGDRKALQATGNQLDELIKISRERKLSDEENQLYHILVERECSLRCKLGRR